MNTKYSNWKMWYYVLCMVLTLQLAACSCLLYKSDAADE